MQEAMLWEKDGDSIRCKLCARKCLIPKDKRGFCDVRVNKGDVLYAENYGKLVAVKVDPVEKKPLFHFFPGTKTLSISSYGCNFRCQFCLNWQISQGGKIRSKTYTPEEIVKLAIKKKCKTIAYTYGEPTIFFEFAYRTAKTARRYNIKNVFVTNGYMTSDGIKKIGKYLDAVTVDLKASADPEFYAKHMSVPDVKPIFDSLKNFKKHRVFIEITNLIVPGIGDNLELNKKLAEWIIEELGSSIPYHIIRFQPHFKMMDAVVTPVKTLENMVADAQKVGLRYVYIGNVRGHKNENTYCYNCRQLLIKRKGFSLEKMDLYGERCPNCGYTINMKGE